MQRSEEQVGGRQNRRRAWVSWRQDGRLEDTPQDNAGVRAQFRAG
jgi:hypothetical protein